MDYSMISRVVVLVAQCLESVLQRGTASAKSQNTQRNAEVQKCRRASVVVKDDMAVHAVRRLKEREQKVYNKQVILQRGK